MSFPPRAAYVYVELSESGSNGLLSRPSGTTVNSLVQMSTVPGDEPMPPTQPSFYGSQMWYQNYPAVCVAKVPMPYYGNYWPAAYSIPATAYGTGNTIYLLPYDNNVLRDSTYPTNIVYEYDPTTPSPADPVPDPTEPWAPSPLQYPALAVLADTLDGKPQTQRTTAATVRSAALVLSQSSPRSTTFYLEVLSDHQAHIIRTPALGRSTSRSKTSRARS